MNRWVLAAVCLFLGFIGAHRFITGKIGTGILWLMTAGCFGIGCLIDFITIICGNFKTASGNYVK